MTTSDATLAALVAEVKAALRAAHALPWRDLHTGLVVNEEDREVPVSFDDSRLIAESPEWLGALVQAVEDQQTEVSRLRADGQRLQRELDDIRAGGLCGYRFDHTVCVGRAGHRGAHLTNNDLFPHGLHDGTRYLAKP